MGVHGVRAEDMGEGPRVGWTVYGRGGQFGRGDVNEALGTRTPAGREGINVGLNVRHGRRKTLSVGALSEGECGE
jgi:hypothetical protein